MYTQEISTEKILICSWRISRARMITSGNDVQQSRMDSSCKQRFSTGPRKD